MATYGEKVKKRKADLEASVAAKYKFFTLAELSALLGIHHAGLRQFVQDGRLKGIKMAGKWRVSKAALDEFLASGGGGPEGANPRSTWPESWKKSKKGTE